MTTKHTPTNSEFNQEINARALQAMAEGVIRRLRRSMSFLPGPMISSAWMNLEEASAILQQMRTEFFPVSWQGQTLKDKEGVSHV